jgi:predicted AAA+ superfamily ATPase
LSLAKTQNTQIIYYKVPMGLNCRLITPDSPAGFVLYKGSFMTKKEYMDQLRQKEKEKQKEIKKIKSEMNQKFLEQKINDIKQKAEKRLYKEKYKKMGQYLIKLSKYNIQIDFNIFKTKGLDEFYPIVEKLYYDNCIESNS